MAEELKERKDCDPRYQWDLTTLYRDDSAWEKDLASLGAAADAVAAFQGKLRDAASIRTRTPQRTMPRCSLQRQGQPMHRS